MNTLRKFFMVSVMVMTVLSMTVVAAPKAEAAAAAGDLIKMNGLSSVYFLAADGKRYVFPNETTYFSWYSDFSGVKTIPQSELESYPLGANVTVRPGTRLVKITTNPKVYAVEPGGKLTAVPDETTAKALYGDNWAKRVSDVPDAFFTNYSIQTGSLTSTAYPKGTLVKKADASDVYYIDSEGKARKIANEAAFLANRFKWSDIITAAASYALPTAGADITGAVSEVTDTSSGAGGAAGAGTGATFALSSATPASATIPSNATGVVFTKFNVTASNDGPVTINEVTVKRTGVGATTDISRVYLYDGDTRLTSGKTVNSSSNESQFTNIGLIVAAGTTKTVSIVADIANSVNGNHAFGIEAATAVTTNGAAVSGSFPIRGNIMTLSTQSVGKVDIESNGSAYTRKVGETNAEVSNFTVYVNSTEDATFNGITLYYTGRDVLSNLKLYRGSDKVAEATKSGTYFIFKLDTPYAIAKGESASFIVKGDVTGRSSDTVTLYTRYNTDVKVVGKTYGYNLGIDGTLGGSSNSYVEETDSSVQSNQTTVQAGQVTVALNGPVAGDVSKNTNDVVLMNFNITAAAPVEVSKLTIDLSDSGALLNAPTDLNDLEVQCKDGNNYVSKALSSSVATSTAFTDIWTIPTGTYACRVIVDIENSATGNEKVKATIKDLTSTTYTTLKDTNNDTISDIVPSGDIAGNEMNITSASLTVNVASTPASGQTYVKGQSEASIVGFTFTAGNAADTKVTAIRLIGYNDEAENGFGGDDLNQLSGVQNDLVSVKIYDGTTLLGTKSFTVGSSDVYVNFDSLTWSIPAGQQKILTVKADVSSALADSDAVAIAISSVTSEYGSGTNLNATLTGTNATTPTVSQTVTTGGTITMAQDADTPVTTLAVMGNTGVSFTKIKFTTTRENFIVDRLRVLNTSYTTNGDDEISAVTLEYKDSSNTTQTVSKGLSAGYADFTGLTFYVPKDDSAVITIKADLNTSTGGADNGATTTLGIDYNDNYRALGQASGVTDVTADNGANVEGNPMYIYKSKPTFAFNSATPSGTLNPSADTLVGIIDVTADAGDDIVFRKATGLSTSTILIKISGSGGSTTSSITWTLKDGDGNQLDTAVTTGNIPSSGYVEFDFSDRAFTVAKGTTKQLRVSTNTQNLSTSGNGIQIYLDDNADTNVDWSINGTGDYGHATILFRGDLFGGSLSKA